MIARIRPRLFDTFFSSRTQAARPRGTCNYPLSLFACLCRQAHALRSFEQPITIQECGLRVIQVPHGLSCLLDQGHLARSAERVRQRGDSFPTKFVINKTREKQRRMSESVYLIREQGSGEPRASRSALIEHSRCELCREGLRVGYNEVSQSECERSSFALAKLSSNERRREASAYGARRGYPTRRPSPRS